MSDGKLKELLEFLDEREEASYRNCEGRDESDPVLEQEAAIRDTLELVRRKIRELQDERDGQDA